MTHIEPVLKKYSNDENQFLDKFETKALTFEVLLRVEEKMPNDLEFY
jgi:hypothetical protein